MKEQPLQGTEKANIVRREKGWREDKEDTGMGAKGQEGGTSQYSSMRACSDPALGGIRLSRCIRQAEGASGEAVRSQRDCRQADPIPLLTGLSFGLGTLQSPCSSSFPSTASCLLHLNSILFPPKESEPR